MTAPSLIVDRTAAEVAAHVATRFLRAVREEFEQRELVHICLTGGSMSAAVLGAIAGHQDAEGLDWRRLHFWWGDERFVPSEHDDRNALLARRALLNHVPVPEQNIHEMPASDQGLSLDEAATAYAQKLAKSGEVAEFGKVAELGTVARPWPSFSLCFLGMGPDGHIASLFPGRPEIDVTDVAAVAIREAPKPPPERVSLTLPVINAAERVWLVVTGAEKAPALARVLSETTPAETPASAARGTVETLIFTDAAACGR